MRKFIFVALWLLILINSYSATLDLKLQEPKQFYVKGDTAIVLVKYTFEQDLCDDAVLKTKFFGKGLKILKKTKWRKLSAKVFTRKVMIKVKRDKKLVFTAVRNASKDEVFEQLELPVRK
jgi:hypothetical protein